MKHQNISRLLERRIRHGDYALTGLPAERDLAGDIGVSRVTIRRALEDLETRGLIERLPNRRVVPSREALSAVGSLQLAFVAPSNGPQSFSLDIQQWLAAADFLAREAGSRLRIVNYHHWDDAAISDALRTYDGIFFVTNSETIPTWAATLLSSSDRVVSLSDDLTHLGVPSINLFPHAAGQRLLRRLEELGHRRVACFNIQGHNAVTLARIDQWRSWSSLLCPNAEFVDQPCGAGDNAFDAGLAVARKQLVALSSETTAIYCVTLPAAMGVVRAAHELGRQVGTDISVCTIDGEGLAQILVPSIACAERPDARQFMAQCIEWFAAGGSRDEWVGPLLIQPNELAICDGESIGPAQP